MARTTSPGNTSSCTVVPESACIQVTKNCPTVTLGQQQTVSGNVTNCGNVTVTNITVTDNVVGNVATIASLAPGATANYSSNFTTTICGTIPSSVAGLRRVNGREGW